MVGSCFELGQAGKVPEYFLMAELSALPSEIKVIVVLNSVPKPQKAKIIGTLRSALESKFGIANVRSSE